MKLTGNTILITGGASGIGKALALEFHKLGNKVIIAGRRKRIIDEIITANPGMSGYVLDVEDPQAIQEFAERVTAEHPDLNVLLNNAGIMKAEDLSAPEIDLSIMETTIATNFVGPIRLTTTLLPHLRKKSKSTIINVSSGLAFVPLALTPTYNATKAAVHSYTISLRHQLRDTDIEVLEIIPPYVQTDLMPGQAKDPHAMPLPEFVDETMSVFQQQPTPQEIKVQRLTFLRDAEAEGRFEQTFEQLNSMH